MIRYTYIRVHLPSRNGETYEHSVEVETRLQFLELLNKWNAQGGDWKFYEK